MAWDATHLENKNLFLVTSRRKADMPIRRLKYGEPTRRSSRICNVPTLALPSFKGSVDEFSETEDAWEELAHTPGRSPVDNLRIETPLCNPPMKQCGMLRKKTPKEARKDRLAGLK